MIDASAFESLILKGVGRKIAIGSVVEGAVATEELGAAMDGPLAIGSLSKVFTSLLLADACLRGEANLDDPIGSWLLEGTPADPSVAHITFGDLSSHSSGLPREAPNLIARFERGELDPDNPFSDFLQQDLIEAYRQVRRGPPKFEYSNFGFMLLAVALERITHHSFRDLIAHRICQPLGLKRTFVKNGQSEPPEHGHNRDGVRVPNWDEPLPGPGGVHSTAEDLCRFLVSATDDADPLGDAFRLMQQPRTEVSSDGERSSTRIGLGWFITQTGQKTWLWHGGSAGGVHGFMAVDPHGQNGLVALGNWFEESRPLDAVAAASLGIPR